MVDRPKKPFTDAHDHRKRPDPKDPLDLNPARDKDNAGRAPKPPTFAPGGGATNLAPRGASAMRQEPPTAPVTPDKPMALDITKGDPNKDLYIHGTIRAMEGYSFVAKVYELPSQSAIEGGKIAKLQIKQGERIVAHFDRGWDVKPLTKNDHAALQKIRTVLDPPEREFRPVVPKPPDKDHGHER